MSAISTRAGLLRLACAMGFAGFALLFAGAAQAKPVEYVKVCSLYGAGFYYIPGTDTCIKIGGYLRVDTTDVGTGTVCGGSYFTPGRTCSGRDLTTVDVRQCTAYGVLRSYYVPQGSNCTPNSGTGGKLSWAWGGFEGGFGASHDNFDTIYQLTFDSFDPLHPDRSASAQNVNARIGLTGGADWIVGAGITHQWFIGLQASVDYETGNFGTIQGIPGSQLFTPLGPGSDSIKLSRPWEFSVGPRVGMTFDNFNLYGTGGVAFGGFNTKVNCGTGLCLQNGIPMAETSSSTVRVGGYGGIGYTTGVGTSTWGDGNWRWGGELRYTDYGSWTATTGNPQTYQGSFNVKANEVSAMLRIMHRSYLP
jgi:opacity protein-like surface antigen